MPESADFLVGNIQIKIDFSKLGVRARKSSLTFLLQAPF
jgi:hypothetical protein